MSQTNWVLPFIILFLLMALLLAWRTWVVKVLWAQPQKRSARILLAVSFVLLLACAIGAPLLGEIMRR